MNNNDTNLNQGNNVNPNQTPIGNTTNLENLEGTTLGNISSELVNPINNSITPTNTAPVNAFDTILNQQPIVNPVEPVVNTQPPVTPIDPIVTSQPTVVPMEPVMMDTMNQVPTNNQFNNGMGMPTNMGGGVVEQPQQNPMNMIPENPVPMDFNAMGSVQPQPIVPENTVVTPPTDAMNPMNLNAMQSMNLTNPANTVNMGVPNAANNMQPNTFVTNNNQPINNGINNNIMEQQPMNPNGMNGVNTLFNAVPTPPPLGDLNQQSTEKKKGKLKFSKTTIILLVVLLIAIIGVGVYFVLNNVKPKSKVSITPKELILDLGKDLSEDALDYATITGTDTTKCTVDTSKIDNKNLGAYDFTVTCGTISKSGKAIVKDQTAPVVTTREIMVTPNSTVVIEDFIVSCVEQSNCSYEMEESTTSLAELVKTEGTYHFNIIASDDYNNEVTVELTLVVSNSAPVRYLYCTQAPTTDDVLKANVEISYNYGIDENDTLSVTEKIYLYTFDDEEDYLALKENYDAKVGINDIIGQTVFDDDEFSVTVMEKMTTSDLENEFSVSAFPTDYSSLAQFNIDQGITCKNR